MEKEVEELRKRVAKLEKIMAEREQQQERSSKKTESAKTNNPFAFLPPLQPLPPQKEKTNRAELLKYKEKILARYGKTCPVKELVISNKFLTPGFSTQIVNLEAAETIDKWGNTGLHLLAFYGEAKILQTLFVDGERAVSTLNHRNKDGYTPVHFAVLAEQFDVLDPLLRLAKADCRLRNNQGETALEMAENYIENWHPHFADITWKLQVYTEQQAEQGLERTKKI